MEVFVGFVLAAIFILGGLSEMKNGGFGGFIAGAGILVLGILYLVASNNTKRENKRKEIDQRVEEALKKRDL